jgi:hypothetical protein
MKNHLKGSHLNVVEEMQKVAMAVETVCRKMSSRSDSAVRRDAGIHV